MSDNLSIVPSMNISASGLDAEMKRMEVIANNIANANTIAGPDGKVFQRKEAVFATKLADAIKYGDIEGKVAGVEVKGIVADQRAPRMVYRPGHPNADQNGYISMPDINPVEEMVDMMSATRSYEANLAAIKSAKSMAQAALGIGK